MAMAMAITAPAMPPTTNHPRNPIVAPPFFSLTVGLAPWSVTLPWKPRICVLGSLSLLGSKGKPAPALGTTVVGLRAGCRSAEALARAPAGVMRPVRKRIGTPLVARRSPQVSAAAYGLVGTVSSDSPEALLSRLFARLRALDDRSDDGEDDCADGWRKMRPSLSERGQLGVDLGDVHRCALRGTVLCLGL